MNYRFSPVIIISVLCLFSCKKVEEVRFSAEEVREKTDSFVSYYKASIEDEYYRSYELRRHIELRQLIEKYLKGEDTAEQDPDIIPNFVDTPRKANGH